MKYILLPLLSIFILLSSCTKEEEPSMRTNVLTKGKWKTYYSVTVTDFPEPVGQVETDLFALMPACEQDNYYIYKMDNSTLTDQGDNFCYPDAGQVYDPQVTWKFEDADTKLRVTDTSRSVLCDLILFSDTAIHMRYTTTDNNITSVTETRAQHF